MYSKVIRRPFGANGILVSEVSLGAMNLRMLKTREEGLQIVNYVLDQGINMIDTARAYKGVNGSGVLVESEDIVGEAIEARTDLDEPIVIVTKGHGYTPEAFDRDLETSCRTLRIKHVGDKLYIGQTEIRLVVFFHGIKLDRWIQMQSSGVIAHAQALQRAGKFTWLGFSAHYGDKECILQAIDSGAMQVVELPYNVFNCTLGDGGEVDLIRRAYERGMAVINMKAFNGNSMVQIHRQLGESMSLSYEDMFRFAVSNPYISTIDAGARYPEEFQRDIEWAGMPKLSLRERAALAEKAALVAPHLDRVCRECMHCLEKFECPQGVDFPKILGLHARYRVKKAFGKDVSDDLALYRAMDASKRNCIACGACEPWCEYHLHIPAMLQAAHEELMG